MSEAMQLFGYETGDVRVSVKDGEPWFAVKDVCEILELSNVTEAVRGLPETDLTSVVLTSGGQKRELTFINEAGLYRLVFRSRKPEAERFQDWICREVIPSIRKTGGYGTAARRGLGLTAADIAAVTELVRGGETAERLLTRARATGSAHAAAAIRTGLLLSRAKMALPHGEYTRWVRENCGARHGIRSAGRCRSEARAFLVSPAAAAFLRLSDDERAAQLSGEADDGDFMAAVDAFLAERGKQ